MRYLIGLLVLCSPLPVHAQKTFSVNGFVRDSVREPVAYCTVSLLQARDSILVGGTSTAPDGSYELSRPQREGKYLLRYDHLGYKTQYLVLPEANVLPDVVLEPSVIQIEAVEFVARRITHKAGKYEFNMLGSSMAKGRSAMQVLELLPGLKNDDNVLTLKNQPVAMVYIDDRRVTDPSELDALRADRIRSIEVQNNTGVAYSATMSGGIVRIRLKKFADGSFYGSVKPEVSASRTGFTTGLGVPFAAQYKRLNIYNYLSGRYQENRTVDHTHAEYRNSGYALDSEDRGRGVYRQINELLSLVYEIDDRHTVGVGGQILMGRSSVDNMIRTRVGGPEWGATPPETGYTRYRSAGQIYNRQYMASLNYAFRIDSLDSRLAFKADYLYYNIAKNYDYDTRNYRRADDPGELSSALSKERYRPIGNLLRSRVDLTKNLTEEQTISAGLSYDLQHVNNHNRIHYYDGATWVPDRDKSFHFIDRTQQAAAYVAWDHSSRKFSYKGGLRLQWDRISYRNAEGSGYKNRDYLRLFPEMSLAYTLDATKGSYLNLDASRYSGSLPGNDLLSPRRVWQSPYSYSVGNEQLDPAWGYDVDLTYTLHEKWYFSYLFSYDRHAEHLTRYDPDEPGIVYTMPVWGAKALSHGLWVNYMASVAKWLRADVWASGYWDQRKFDTCREESWRSSVGANLAFQPFQTMRITLSGGFDSPVKRIESRTNETYRLNIRLDKSFFEERLQLSLGVYNIVHNRLEQTTRRMDGSYYAVLRQPKGYRDLRIAFSVAWNFNRNAGRAVKLVESTQQQDEVLE